jgi:hypothetical protein
MLCVLRACCGFFAACVTHRNPSTAITIATLTPTKTNNTNGNNYKNINNNTTTNNNIIIIITIIIITTTNHISHHHSARRVMWGRCLNAGQTCIAADYVLCHHKVADAFAAACVAVLSEFFGKEGEKMEQNLSRIAAERHFDRLSDMLKRA